MPDSTTEMPFPSILEDILPLLRGFLETHAARIRSEADDLARLRLQVDVSLKRRLATSPLPVGEGARLRAFLGLLPLLNERALTYLLGQTIVDGRPGDYACPCDDEA